jgi:hypothetical protein
VVKVAEDQDTDYLPSEIMDLMAQIYNLDPALILFADPAANASTYNDVDNYPLINGAWWALIVQLPLSCYTVIEHASYQLLLLLLIMCGCWCCYQRQEAEGLLASGSVW